MSTAQYMSALSYVTHAYRNIPVLSVTISCFKLCFESFVLTLSAWMMSDQAQCGNSINKRDQRLLLLQHNKVVLAFSSIDIVCIK